MKIISNKKELINIIRMEKNLGFVPTMGGIHNAHLSLVKKCARLCNKSIVSIFINKPQFNRKMDFKKYPRVLKRDISLLKKHSVSEVVNIIRLFTEYKKKELYQFVLKVRQEV